MSERTKRTGGMIAVLTGDLVGSREMTADRLEAVRVKLENVVAALEAAIPGLVIGSAQFFRGDSWQLALARPGMFLRVAVALRTALRGTELLADTRIGVGIGMAERIDENQISVSVGEGFTLSGEALDDLAGAIGMRFKMARIVADRLALLPAVLSYTDEMIDRLKPAQSETLWLALLPGHSQADIARLRGVSEPTVSQALSGIGYRSLALALDAVENMDWSKLPGPRIKLI